VSDGAPTGHGRGMTLGFAMIRNVAAQRGGFYRLACANSNLSGLDADYVRSDFAVHSSAPEPLRDSFSSDVGCLAKP